MATVYVIGDEEVFLNWYAYRDYCIANGLKVEYEEPEILDH